MASNNIRRTADSKRKAGQGVSGDPVDGMTMTAEDKAAKEAGDEILEMMALGIAAGAVTGGSGEVIDMIQGEREGMGLGTLLTPTAIALLTAGAGIGTGAIAHRLTRGRGDQKLARMMDERKQRTPEREVDPQAVAMYNEQLTQKAKQNRAVAGVAGAGSLGLATALQALYGDEPQMY